MDGTTIDYEERCPDCEGSGILGDMATSPICHVCGGSGLKCITEEEE